MKTLPCIILAGGKSSRMGQDKALMPFGEAKSLTEYQYHKFQCHFDDVYISCKSKEKFDFEAKFLEDKGEVFAPTIALDAVFERLGCEAFFVVAVDMPFISERVLKTLLKSDYLAYDATVVSEGEQVHTLCGIYTKGFKPYLEDAIKRDHHKLKGLLSQAHTQTIPIEEKTTFDNLNHPEEYIQAIRELSGQ